MKTKHYLIAFFLTILLSQQLNSHTVKEYSPIPSEGYLLSFKYYNESLLRMSEKQLLKALDEFPDAPAVDKSRILEAYINLADKNYLLADASLSDFLVERSNSPFVAPAAFLRASLSFDKKDYERAATLFEESLMLSNSEFNARADSNYLNIANNSLYWKAVSLVIMGKNIEAKQTFEECYRLYPSGDLADDALFALGYINETNRQYDAAISYYSTISSKYSYSNSLVAAKLREINIRLTLRDGTSALNLIENTENIVKEIQKDSEESKIYESQSNFEQVGEELLYLRAEANNVLGNFTQSLDYFKEFEQKYPDSQFLYLVYLSAGWANLNLEKQQEALDYYDKVIEIKDLKEENVKALAQFYRTIALKRQGKTEEAKKELSSLAIQATYPYPGFVLLELGQIQYEEKDFASAAKTLERAYREASDAVIQIRIYLILGATYLELRRWESAIEAYKLAEQIAIKSSNIYVTQKEQYLAEAKLKMGIAYVQNYKNAEAITPLQSFLSEYKKDKRADEAAFWLAEAFYRTDLLNNAITSYKSLLEKHPNTKRKEEALYGLGWASFRMRNFKEATVYFDRLIQEFPNTKYASEVLARKGDGYYVIKDYNKAVTSYRQAIKIDPTSEEGQYCSYQLSHALFRLSRYDEAVSELLAFLKTNPKSTYSPYSLYLIGWIRFQQKRYAESIDNYRYLIQGYKNSDLVVRAHYAIGDAYYNMGNFEAALEAYNLIVEQYPSSPIAPEALKSIQYCLMSLGRESEAMQIADKYVESNPSSPFAPEFKFKKAEMFYTGKRFQDAISEYEEFIRKYPSDEKKPEALFWMAKSYANMNEIKQAEDVFKQILKEFPESDYAPLSILERALLDKQNLNIERADSLFKELQRIYPDDPNSAQAGFELATIRYSLGDTLDAIRIFRETANHFDDIEYGLQSRYKLAMFYRYRSENDSARLEFSRLAEKYAFPEIAAESQYRIGELWMRENNYTLATAAFLSVQEKFSAYEDWYSLSLLNIGECWEKLERYAKAIEAYQTLASLRPDDDFGASAKKRLKDLQKK